MNNQKQWAQKSEKTLYPLIRHDKIHVHAPIAPRIIFRGSTRASDCVLSCVRRQVLISLGYGQDMQVREKSHRFTFDTWQKSRSVVIFVFLCFPDTFVSSTVLAKLMVIRLPFLRQMVLAPGVKQLDACGLSVHPRKTWEKPTGRVSWVSFPQIEFF